MWKKFLLPLVKSLLAIFIIFILIKKGNVDSSVVCNLDPLLLAGALSVIWLQNMLAALRWRSLLQAVGIKISFFTAVSLTMQGIFWMLFLPGGTLGGDLVKAGLAAKDQNEDLRVKAAFSVIMDRICGFCGLALLSWAVAVCFLLAGFDSNFALYYILCCTVAAAPLALIAVATAMHWCKFAEKVKILQRLIDFADRITRGNAVKLLDAVNSFCFVWKRCFFWSVISGMVAFPLFIVGLIFVSSAVQGCFTADGLLGSVMCGSIGEFAGIIPLTPGGIGVRDAFFSFIYNAFDVENSAAAAIPVTFTFLTVISSLPGGIFALFMLINKKHCR